MKMTVVVSDGFVQVDGRGFSKLDLSFLPRTMHAIQWNGGLGEVEWLDPVTGRSAGNERVTTLPYQNQLLLVWNDAVVASDLAAAKLNKSPTDDPNYVPQSVTALQGLLALDASNLAEYYETWASSPERTFSERAFINKAQSWKRDDPILVSAATSLGLTGTQIDSLFKLAATL